jgi:hypothetical protein
MKILDQLVKHLKVGTNEKLGGSGRWPMIGFVCPLFFHFAAILYKTNFRFRSLQPNN